MTVKVLGIPYDRHSSFMRGPSGAPAAVRAALTCGSANWCTESGLDLNPELARGLKSPVWEDLGDLRFVDGDPHDPAVSDRAEDAVVAIRSAVADAIADGSPLLSIGGDHMVAWPVVQAVTARYDDLTIVHLDAHPDLYDELDGDRFSHACPFARIMEEGKVSRLIQFGIRTMTPHQQAQADRFGVEVYPLRDWDGSLPPVSGPVYLSVDIDVLDPAFAPGISHYEPGGMSTRQLLDTIRQIERTGVSVVGADLVEINPDRDVNGMTAMVGAKLVRELLGLLIASEER